MTAPTSSALTDDEILAVSVLTDRPWPSGLPTVPADEEAVRSATTRGLRSLSVRGLLEARDGRSVLSDAVAGAVGGVAAAPTILSAAVVLATEPLGSFGPAMIVGAHDSHAVVDIVSGDGVHLLTTVDPSTAEEEFSRFLRAVFDGDRAPEGTPERALLVRSSAKAASQVVLPGRILAGELDEGTSTLRPTSVSTDWDGFRARLGILPSDVDAA